MITVALFNETGQQLTEVNINRSETECDPVDGVQWGGNIFMWDDKLQHFRIATIKPAIINKGGKR